MHRALHLTKDVSPKALRTIEGIPIISLYVSEVQDSDLDRVVEMAKAILPQDKKRHALVSVCDSGQISSLIKIPKYIVTVGDTRSPPQAMPQGHVGLINLIQDI
ncbi:hypothetical protein GWK47_047513 [Chionoecetes opilio]|uniref:Uncharacterized protein n=1 Tax=Chionoecetes opilio TaxID=41210 RepID=A0A8J5CUD0_CHIOP|nr:hypothetical protein GWK47_047513 [Chionoecetes opilio]